MICRILLGVGGSPPNIAFEMLTPSKLSRLGKISDIAESGMPNQLAIPLKTLLPLLKVKGPSSVISSEYHHKSTEVMKMRMFVLKSICLSGLMMTYLDNLQGSVLPSLLHPS